jgi:hypothetical protein
MVFSHRRFMGYGLGLGLAASLAAADQETLVVRVRDTAGGPQIHVNGKPLPPRFFWGSENSGRVALTPAWAERAFEFTPDSDVAGNGTLHFRFADTPCEIWIKDLRITDAATGADVLPPGSFASTEAFRKAWGVWPVGAENTVGQTAVEDGALKITLRAPGANAKWPDFHLHSRGGLAFAKGRTYRCTFRVKGTPDQHLLPCVYRVDGGVHSRIGGPQGSF